MLTVTLTIIMTTGSTRAASELVESRYSDAPGAVAPQLITNKQRVETESKLSTGSAATVHARWVRVFLREIITQALTNLLKTRMSNSNMVE